MESAPEILEEPGDLSLWTGKPPAGAAAVRHSSQQETGSDDSDTSERQQSVQPSEDSSDGEGIAYDGSSLKVLKSGRQNVDSDSEDLNGPLQRLQKGFYIDLPSMDHDEKKEYKHLPGHFSAAEITSETRNGRFHVKLQSGEDKLVSRHPSLSSLLNASLYIRLTPSDHSLLRVREIT